MLAASLIGCGDDLQRRCEDAVSIDETTVEGGPVGTAEVTLRGLLVRPNDVTVYSLSIGGQLATDEGEDFRQFSVKLPAGIPVDADGTLAVVATTNCSSGNLAALHVDVPTSPSASAIEIEPLLEDYLPLTPVVPAELIVTASEDSNAKADGLVVELSTTLGILSPTSITLQVDDSVPPQTTATAYLSPPDESGVAVVTARAGALVATRRVVFLGPPKLAPASTDLARGVRLDIHVELPSAAGATVQLDGPCSVSAAADIAVVHDGDDVSLTPAPDSVEGHAAHVTCVDVFGQLATADYVVEVP